MNRIFSQKTWRSSVDQSELQWGELQWGELTEEVATHIDGQREMIVTELEERFGFTKEQAEYVLDDFLITRR